MTRWYVDSSAALKLLLAEAESDALSRVLANSSAQLVSAELIETELRRAVARHRNLTQEAVSTLLQAISVAAMPRSLFQQAGLLGGAALRSLDALHVATALRLGADCVLTYDHRMASAARDLGLPVLAPS